MNNSNNELNNEMEGRCPSCDRDDEKRCPICGKKNSNYTKTVLQIDMYNVAQCLKDNSIVDDLTQEVFDTLKDPRLMGWIAQSMAKYIIEKGMFDEALLYGIKDSDLPDVLKKKK